SATGPSRPTTSSDPRTRNSISFVPLVPNATTALAQHAPEPHNSTTGATVSAGDAAPSLPPRGAEAAPARRCCCTWQRTTRLRPEPASRVTTFGQEQPPAIERDDNSFRLQTLAAPEGVRITV